ncbi:hypothetical protein [Flexithrix dorotheae]|uniref:hypothetical protein n=1 Tax=Flexithrix dorotheae TaxID=70993 RepID=UPI000378B992|nr:hypothetical protein [Flexithrix dorotheae]
MDVSEYLIKALTVFLLSLWKTYVGPALSFGFGFSYFEMVIFNYSAALISALVSLYFAPNIVAFIRRLFKMKPKPYNARWRKILVFWNKYGFYGVMVLSPILISIPLGAIISQRFKTPAPKILIYLSVMVLFWSSLAYFLAKFGMSSWME